MTADTLRICAALALALAVSLAINRRSADGPSRLHVSWRWAAALTLMTLVLWLGVFMTVATADGAPSVDLDRLSPPQLMLTPLLLLAAAAVWSLLAWGRDPRARRALGLVAERPWVELGIGLVAGVAAWAVVLVFMLLLGVVLMLTGGGALPGAAAPSPLVVWLAGLSIPWRLAVSLAAGISEELFFRGLLQQRVGIALSTVIFVLGHVVYGAPLMLVGLTLLSVIYALLVRWRGSIWAAVAAHAVFDAIQLLVVIPAALGVLDAAGVQDAGGAVAGISFCYAPR